MRKRRHAIEKPLPFVPRADRSLKKIFARIGSPELKPFKPDGFQAEALEKIKQCDVLVSAPTGSGKTWIAQEAMRAMLEQGKRCWYASPLKALSNSKYHEFSAEFGSEHVGVLTGDRKENTNASIVVGTTEILRNQLYDAMARVQDFNADLVVLDEAHYLGDIDRGVVWEEVMIYLPTRVRLLMLSATVSNADEIANWLISIRSHPCSVVFSNKRPVPNYPLYLLPGGELVPLSGVDGVVHKIEHVLQHSQGGRFRRSQFQLPYEAILRELEHFNLLPAIFFLKSRSDCNNALQACRHRFVSKEKTRRIKHVLEEIIRQYPFLSTHSQLQSICYHGIGAHHGGQLPHWKIVVEKLMNAGCLDAIFSTSTVAAGVNFPARTVVLAQSDRFNGKAFVDLTATDLHQATGRAGRRGKDNVGFSVMVHGPFQNPHLIDTLIHADPEPIKSRITINFSMCLNLLVSQTPDGIHSLLKASLATFQNTASLRKLEERHTSVMRSFQQHMNGLLCTDAEQVQERSLQRKESFLKLNRLKKKRRKLARNLKLYNHEVDETLPLQDIDRDISRQQEVLDHLPCGRCPNDEVCGLNKKHFFSRLADEAAWISKAFSDARDALWIEFKRHSSFLVLTGFARDDGSLTEDGYWAAKLRLDQPLIIAELIRKGVLEKLTPDLMCALIAVFVNDKFRDIDIADTVHWDRRELKRSYELMKSEVEAMVALKKQHGFSVPNVQFWPAAALYLWSQQRSWDDVQLLAGVDEGDLAMLIFRTADNLRQLVSLEATHPGLASKARACIRLLLREPVVLPL
jgi:superfamily II RNA helicase